MKKETKYSNAQQKGEKAIKVVKKSTKEVLKTMILRQISALSTDKVTYYSLGMTQRRKEDNYNRKLGLKIARGRCEKVYRSVVSGIKKETLHNCAYRENGKKHIIMTSKPLSKKLYQPLLTMIVESKYQNIGV
jgi:hypothetical protein